MAYKPIVIKANKLLYKLIRSAEILRGSVAERSKALVLSISLFGGVGSNPTAAISSVWLF
jgi:hypothetical protein